MKSWCRWEISAFEASIPRNHARTGPSNKQSNDGRILHKINLLDEVLARCSNLYIQIIAFSSQLGFISFTLPTIKGLKIATTYASFIDQNPFRSLTSSTGLSDGSSTTRSTTHRSSFRVTFSSIGVFLRLVWRAFDHELRAGIHGITRCTPWSGTVPATLAGWPPHPFAMFFEITDQNSPCRGVLRVKELLKTKSQAFEPRTQTEADKADGPRCVGNLSP